MPRGTTLLSDRASRRPALEVVAFCALSLVAVLGCRLLTNGIFASQDEGLLLVYPDLILRGAVPYKDFASLYPPGGLYLLAGLFRVFGDSVFVERALAAAYWWLMVLAVFLVGSRVSHAIAILAATTALAYLSLTGTLGAYTHFGAYACMFFALAFSSGNLGDHTARSTRSVAYSGAIAGAAMWFKQDFGVIAVFAAFVSIDPRDPRRLQAFLTGVALPVSALIVFAAIVGPAQVFDSVVLDTIRSAPGRFSPLHLRWDLAVIGACNIVQCVIALRVRGPAVPYNLRWLSRGMATLSVGYSVSVLHRTAPGDIGYYAFLVISLTLVSISIFMLHLGVGLRSRRPAVITFFLLGLLPLVIAQLTTSPGMKFNQSWVSSRGRSAPVMTFGSSKRSDLQTLLDEIVRASRAGQGLFVGPSDLRFAVYNDTFIYFLLPELRPVSRYLEMNPGCANRQGSGLTKEIARADWLILTTRYDAWNKSNASLLPGPAEPNNLVQKRFCLQSRHGDWTLLHRCSSNEEEVHRSVDSTRHARREPAPRT